MSVVLHDGKIVGAGYRTLISHDGAAVVSHGGLRPTSDREWNMVWDGHHFALPPAGSVLYYPGHPGQGSTITDFSHSFADSGINTDQALDDSETGVDCDADATAAIPVDSIIRVESELMYVTATGVTLTVIRGYQSTAASHDNTKGIYVRTKNDGTIVGATWRQLPSGLPMLHFDGNDYVDCGDDVSLDIIGGLTLECVFSTETIAPGSAGLITRDQLVFRNYLLQRNGDKMQFVFWSSGDGKALLSDTPLLVDKLYYGVGVYNKIDLRVYMQGVLDSTPLAETGDIDNDDVSLWLGNKPAGDAGFVGLQTLWIIRNYAISAEQVANNFAVIRHLIGV